MLSCSVREAIELIGMEPGSFDTVVLNSVVQYFPDVDYLIAVLKGAIGLVSAKGRVFVGDVRHLGLLHRYFAVRFSLPKAGPRD